MNKSPAELLHQAYLEVYEQHKSGKLQYLKRDLLWRGKAINSFQEWFTSLFAQYHSETFIVHREELLKFYRKDWKQARDLAKLAIAATPVKPGRPGLGRERKNVMLDIEVLEKLQQEDNASDLINNLLRQHYQLG